VGAAAGGVLGGVGGYLYAEHRNSEMRSAAMAAQSYNYNPSRGNVVNIDRADVSPSRVRAGQSVSMVMQYTILTPGNYPVSVSLTREIRKDGVPVGQPYQTTVNNANGTFMDQVAYTVPGNAVPGTYTVASRLDSSVGSAQRDTYFIVD
jgi:hypothetical protein